MTPEDPTPQNPSGCRRKIVAILITSVLGMILAVGATAFFPKLYVSSTTIQVKGLTASAASTESGAPARLQSPEVLDAVIEKLQLREKWGITDQPKIFAKLRQKLRIQEIPNGDLIQIAVLHANPAEAAQIANTLVEEFQRQQAGPGHAAPNPSSVTIWERAEVPSVSVLPNIYLNLVVGALVGFVVGAMLAVVIK